MTIDELAQLVADLGYKVVEVRNSQDRIEHDLTGDRQRLDNIENRLKTVEGKQDTLNERVPRMDMKLKDSMAEVAAPMIEATDKLTEEIKRKTIITREVKPTFFRSLFKKRGERK